MDLGKFTIDIHLISMNSCSEHRKFHAVTIINGDILKVVTFRDTTYPTVWLPSWYRSNWNAVVNLFIHFLN